MERDASTGQPFGEGRVEQGATQRREGRRVQDVEQGAQAMVEDVARVGFAQRVDRFGAEAAELVGNQLRVGLALARGDREGAVVGLRMAEEFRKTFRRVRRVGR